jgi:hypothetical protein
MRRHDLFASPGRFGTLWLNREADKHFEQSVENLKDLITGQASILAFGPPCALTRAYSSQKTCHSQTDAPARSAPPAGTVR